MAPWWVVSRLMGHQVHVRQSVGDMRGDGGWGGGQHRKCPTPIASLRCVQTQQTPGGQFRNSPQLDRVASLRCVYVALRRRSQPLFDSSPAANQNRCYNLQYRGSCTNIGESGYLYSHRARILDNIIIPHKNLKNK